MPCPSHPPYYKYINRKINVNILRTDVRIKSLEIMMTVPDLKTKQLMTELCNVAYSNTFHANAKGDPLSTAVYMYTSGHLHFRPSALRQV
jgi:hypothetical protein